MPRALLPIAALLCSLPVYAAPFPYVPATAYHILPQTTSEESGYFSLCEGLDGSIYIGTAKYGENAFLVEFDPRTEQQRIVIDTNKVCGLDAVRGYAAQAKIHTRNFVASSGVIYVGSKQGYRRGKDDTADYPGGYVMTYDPRTGEARNLGMPLEKQGVIDVVADESRNLLYVVTCEDQHWMLGNTNGGKYRELGPMLTPYATTLIDPSGKAHAITKDFQLATYDPTADKVSTRPIDLAGKPFTRADNNSIPTWVASADHRRAYLILMNDPTLLEIDLGTTTAIRHGRMIEGKHPDCRSALTLSPDGRIYALVRTDNDTGFGTGYLHHLARFDPTTSRAEDLGVLTVSNPDYFPFDQKPPHSHGFHRLPDGTLTPLHVHMALMAARDGTLYATVLYPFTLLRIEGYKLPPPPAAKDPVSQSLHKSIDACDAAERALPQITRFAEVIASRHEAGGLIGFPFESQSLSMELWGRAGGLMHVGFTQPWKKDRSESQRANDIAIVGYDRQPGSGDLAALQKLKARGCYLLGIGPRGISSLQPIAQLCDGWLDTGDAAAGRQATLANAVVGWTLIAEIVGALTRDGHMPPIWKSFAFADARAWNDRYFLKTQFHDDQRVAPQPVGALGAAYLCRIRYLLRRLDQTQTASLESAAREIAAEFAAGRKITVAWQGHMPMAYIGKFDDSWAIPAECHPALPQQVQAYRKATPDGALVLSLGYHGLDPTEAALWQEKRQRVIHLCGDHPDPAWRDYHAVHQHIDLGFAFGDGCVTLPGYPLHLFPASGILQLAAYDAIAAAAMR